jgi:hypothetical protein
MIRSELHEILSRKREEKRPDYRWDIDGSILMVVYADSV